MEDIVRNSTLIPFSISEERVRDRFIDWIIADNNAPVDVAYTAKILKIRRLFFPVRRFHVTYSAQWSATSIYEHQEEYEVYTPKLKYVDCNGRQHDRPGEDYLDEHGRPGQKLNSSSTRHPWQPVQVMEKSTKTKTVVDGTERTRGGIGPYSNVEYIALCTDKIIEPFLEKAAENATVKAEDVYLHDCTVMPLTESEKSAWERADDRTYDLAEQQSREQAPGDKIKDFSIIDYRSQYTTDIVLVSVYEVTYEHNGKEYKCWLYGNGQSAFIYVEKPHADSIEEEKKNISQEIQTHSSTQLKAILISAGMAVLGFLGFVEFIVSPVAGILIIGACVYVVSKQIKAWKLAKSKIAQLKQMQSNYDAMLKEKKAAIAAIVKNKEMSWPAKDEAVKKILS